LTSEGKKPADVFQVIHQILSSPVWNGIAGLAAVTCILLSILSLRANSLPLITNKKIEGRNGNLVKKTMSLLKKLRCCSQATTNYAFLFLAASKKNSTDARSHQQSSMPY